MYRIRKYVHANGRIPFDEWLYSLKDKQTSARLFKRLIRIKAGNPGDWRSIGDGVFEIREHFGKGYRIYVGIDKRTLILLLCGGDKSTQSRDIKRAKQFWQEYLQRKK